MKARRPKNRWQRRRAGERRGASAQTQPARQRARLFRFGPGLVVALVAIVVVWRASPEHFRTPRPSLSTPPSAASPHAPPEEAPAALDPGFLLDHSAELGLTPTQRQALVAVRARYDRDTGALQRELEWAARDFQGGMAAQGGKGVTIGALQERAAETSALSHQLAAARRAAWEEAAPHLTLEQRERAEALWRLRMEGRR
jgi:hypothetical protein